MKTKNCRKIIYIIFSIAIIFLIVKSFSNKNNIFLNDLSADINNSPIGYACDRYSGLCIVDKTNAEYTSEKDCLKVCPDLRFKWYCNSAAGQCVRDSRGTYNSNDACWKDCYKKVLYSCNLLYGVCEPQINHKLILGRYQNGDSNTGINGIYNMTIEECSQKCRPISDTYTFKADSKECLWADPKQKWNKAAYTKHVKEGWMSSNNISEEQMNNIEQIKVNIPSNLLIIDPQNGMFKINTEAINQYLKQKAYKEDLINKVIDWAQIEKGIAEQYAVNENDKNEYYLSWIKCGSKAGISDPTNTKIRYSCQKKTSTDYDLFPNYGSWNGYWSGYLAGLNFIVYVNDKPVVIEPKECYASPTGEFENYSNCFEACYQSPLETYQNYSGWNCNYKEGRCVLTKTNAEFQATTLEDSFEICKQNCAPWLDSEIIEDYQCRYSSNQINP